MASSNEHGLGARADPAGSNPHSINRGRRHAASRSWAVCEARASFKATSFGSRKLVPSLSLLRGRTERCEHPPAIFTMKELGRRKPLTQGLVDAREPAGAFTADPLYGTAKGPSRRRTSNIRQD